MEVALSNGIKLLIHSRYMFSKFMVNFFVQGKWMYLFTEAICTLVVSHIGNTPTLEYQIKGLTLYSFWELFLARKLGSPYLIPTVY